MKKLNRLKLNEYTVLNTDEMKDIQGGQSYIPGYETCDLDLLHLGCRDDVAGKPCINFGDASGKPGNYCIFYDRGSFSDNECRCAYIY